MKKWLQSVLLSSWFPSSILCSAASREGAGKGGYIANGQSLTWLALSNLAIDSVSQMPKCCFSLSWDVCKLSNDSWRGDFQTSQFTDGTMYNWLATTPVLLASLVHLSKACFKCYQTWYLLSRNFQFYWRAGIHVSDYNMSLDVVRESRDNSWLDSPKEESDFDHQGWSDQSKNDFHCPWRETTVPIVLIGSIREWFPLSLKRNYCSYCLGPEASKHRASPKWIPPDTCTRGLLFLSSVPLPLHCSDLHMQADSRNRRLSYHC